MKVLSKVFHVLFWSKKETEGYKTAHFVESQHGVISRDIAFFTVGKRLCNTWRNFPEDGSLHIGRSENLETQLNLDQHIRPFELTEHFLQNSDIPAVRGSSVFFSLQPYYRPAVLNCIYIYISLRININVEWNDKEEMKCIAVMEYLEIASLV